MSIGTDAHDSRMPDDLHSTRSTGPQEGEPHNLARNLWAEDNLSGLARVQSNSVGLAYLDPPFNSGRTYDAIVGSSRAAGASHRRGAFVDAWRWSDQVERTLQGLSAFVPKGVAELVQLLATSLERNETASYLVMMVPRLGDLHRALTQTGSLYVHCDPASSHYLKIVLDRLFGADNFRNEIIWKRTHAHSNSKRYGPVHDVILFYSRSARFTWNPVYSEYRDAYIAEYFRSRDEEGPYQLITCNAPGDRTGTKAHYEWRGRLPPPGRHWAWQREQMEQYEREGRLVYSANGVPRFKRHVHDGLGVPVQDVWVDINRLDAHSEERTGYETQKPLALLERIIRASSNPGDLVLDPFCGTGTTLLAAEKLGRNWIGMDISLLAASISLARLRREVNLGEIALRGFPSDSGAARQLQQSEPSAFGLWGASMLATLADRRAYNGSLTTGTGRLRVAGTTLDILSWVPLQSEAQPMLPVAKSPLPKVGFLLRVDQQAADLYNWLHPQLNDVPIYQVGVENLVEPDSLRLGLASQVVSLTAA